MIPEYLIIHCSASPDHVGTDFDNIKRYHVYTRGWSDIGYHFVVEKVNNEYRVFKGRPTNVPGAHCKEKRMNYRSLGICMVGGDPYEGFGPKYPINNKQWNKTIELAAQLCQEFNIPVKNIYFHKDFAPKPCPGVGLNRETFRKDVANFLNNPDLWKYDQDEMKEMERKVLSLGSRGQSVMWIQEKLGLTPTGFFGDETDKAVREFQHNQHILQDGIVGEQTWEKLFKVYGG